MLVCLTLTVTLTLACHLHHYPTPTLAHHPTLTSRRKVRALWYRTPKYIEVTCDINSNGTAMTATNLVRGLTKSLLIDMAILIEGQSASELPEVSDFVDAHTHAPPTHQHCCSYPAHMSAYRACMA